MELGLGEHQPQTPRFAASFWISRIVNGIQCTSIERDRWKQGPLSWNPDPYQAFDSGFPAASAPSPRGPGEGTPCPPQPPAGYSCADPRVCLGASAELQRLDPLTSSRPAVAASVGHKRSSSSDSRGLFLAAPCALWPSGIVRRSRSPDPADRVATAPPARLWGLRVGRAGLAVFRLTLLALDFPAVGAHRASTLRGRFGSWPFCPVGPSHERKRRS